VKTRIACVLAAIFFCACGDGATRAVVVVDADPATRAMARSLEILVLTGTEQRLVTRRVYRVPQDRELPTTVVLVPRPNEPLQGFTVIASVYADEAPAGDPLASRLLLAGYTPGQTTTFHLFLTDSEAPVADAGVPSVEVLP